MNIFDRIQNEIEKKKEEKRLAEERKRRQEKLEKIYELIFLCASAIGLLAIIISGDSYDTGNDSSPVTEQQEEVGEAAPDLIVDQGAEPEELDPDVQEDDNQTDQESETDQVLSLACVETGLSPNLRSFAENYNKTHTDQIDVRSDKIELPNIEVSYYTSNESPAVFIRFESTMDQTEENRKLFLDEVIEYLPLLNPCYTTETGTEMVNQVLASQDHEGNISWRGTFETEDLTGHFVEYVSKAPFNINYIFEI